MRLNELLNSHPLEPQDRLHNAEALIRLRPDFTLSTPHRSGQARDKAADYEKRTGRSEQADSPRTAIRLNLKASEYRFVPRALKPATVVCGALSNPRYGIWKRVIDLAPNTGKPWKSNDTFRNHHWQPLLKRAEVRYRRPYQLRHTFASTMISSGENIHWVARQFGHKDVTMVLRTYGHGYRKSIRVPAAKLRRLSMVNQYDYSLLVAQMLSEKRGIPGNTGELARFSRATSH